MPRNWFVTAILLFALAAHSEGDTTTRPATPGFSQAMGPREWAFPRDHGRHGGFKTEWWYFTGNLRDEAGHRFGYQLTFFRTAVAPAVAERPSPWAMRDLYFAHAAISAIDGKQFIFKDRMQRGRPGLAFASDQTLDVSLLDWSAKQLPDGIALRANEPGFGIELQCGPGRGPVLQGPGGVNAKGRERGQASYYYSMTRLPTKGTLSVGGKKFQVTGLSWMDHEFSSNALAPGQSGWDWMGLTLATGDDLMLYRIRDRNGGADYISGTRITADGVAHYLAATDITMDGVKPWKSPTTGATYPQEWKLKCAGLPGLIVRSEMAGQELITKNSTDVDYFEG
ncbi:MAG TPA: lipocalin-like domain-containing protein, partial [Tepidisphaeraceae bacterium]|nr:lipocalin-like domain-containing protein [Tepidisphaeraceae bacterium]